MALTIKLPTMVPSERPSTIKYEINKPAAELTDGYVVIGLKYVTLLIVGWLAGWVIILFVSTGRRRSGTGLTTLLLDHTAIISTAVALGVVYFFGKRAYAKYALGLLTSIKFDDEKEQVTLTLLNTITGTQAFRTIDYGDLRSSIAIKEDQLFGKQRIVELYAKDALVNRLNIALTAWCRHEDIEEMVIRLDAFNKPGTLGRQRRSGLAG